MWAMRKTHYRPTDCLTYQSCCLLFRHRSSGLPTECDSRDSDENHIRSVSFWLCVERLSTGKYGQVFRHGYRQLDR
jgi:hypothetical protein